MLLISGSARGLSVPAQVHLPESEPSQARPGQATISADDSSRVMTTVRETEREGEGERQSTVRALELDSALKNINREHAPLAMPLKTNGRSQ